MDIWIIVLLILGIGIAFYFVKRKSKKKVVKAPPIDLTESAKWTLEEIMLCKEINLYRLKNNLKVLFKNNDMKVLTQGRVKYWIKYKIIKYKLHNWINAHILTYKEMGYSDITELAQAGYRKIFNAFKNSESHNKALLNSKYSKIAITVRKNSGGKNRTCLILAK